MELAERNAALWWRGFVGFGSLRQFGSFGSLESRYPSAYPYYIYRYIYLLYPKYIQDR